MKKMGEMITALLPLLVLAALAVAVPVAIGSSSSCKSEEDVQREVLRGGLCKANDAFRGWAKRAEALKKRLEGVVCRQDGVENPFCRQILGEAKVAEQEAEHYHDLEYLIRSELQDMGETVPADCP